MISWWCFKNTYELLNLRVLNFHPWIKSTSFIVWVRYFVWNFQGTFWNSTQNILPIHWEIWFLYTIEILRALRFKRSYAFLNAPPHVLKHSPGVSFDYQYSNYLCYRIAWSNCLMTARSLWQRTVCLPMSLQSTSKIIWQLLTQE